MVPTKEELDALERHVSGQLRDIRQSRQLTETVGVHGPTVLSLIAAARELKTYRRALPLRNWHEDVGSALWWRFPVTEEPYAGSPLDTEWPGYHTHWTPFVVPTEPTNGR